MKKLLPAFLFVFLVVACSNPVLKWIDTFEESGSRKIGQPDAKEILSFTFGIEGETDLPIGKTPDSAGRYPIRVILPMGINAGSLRPSITYIGRHLEPPSDEAADFRFPVVYTVTAEDDSTRDYLANVYVKDEASKAIVRFAIDVSGTGDSALSADGIIDEEAGTIFVYVPSGTDTRFLTAHIAHTGVNVTGPLGNPHLDTTFNFTGDFSAPTTWTVIAQNHTTKTYTVTVLREKSGDKEITRFGFGISGESDIIGGEPRPDGKYPILVIVPDDTSTLSRISSTPPFIAYTGVSISPGTDTALDFSPLRTNTYTVTAEDRSTREYAVTTITKDAVFDSTAQIIGFYFADPLVEGIIDENAKTIALTVPAGTNLSSLKPEVYYIGESVSPMSGQPRDFGNSVAAPVVYRVLSRDRTRQASYKVSVFSNGSPARPSVDIPGTTGETVSTGLSPDGRYTIIVELPPGYTGSPTVNISSGASSSVSAPVTPNVVTNINNTYNVIVLNTSGTPGSGAPSIDAFYFASPAAIGNINQSTGDITVSVPYGTNLPNLEATILYTGKELKKGSGSLPGSSPLRDVSSFSSPVEYAVVSQDGNSSKTYRVTVTAAPNNAKEISAFSFGGIDTSSIISAGPNAAGKYPIVVTVPQSTPLSSLTPRITHTGVSITGLGVALSTTATVLGSASDFSNAYISASPVVPAEYTVTAQDGTAKTYAVTVRTTDPADDPRITGFYFTDPLAVGAIDQDSNTITLRVPSNTNRNGLKPTVYFSGASVSPGSGGAVNFTGPVTYTVTGFSGKTRSYVVTVAATPSSAKDITRFKFPGIPNGETVIGAVPNSDGTYPISVWVPAGTPLGNLAPDIAYTGGSITPAGGKPLNFNGPQTFTVTAEDGSAKTYTVTVGTHSGATKLISSLVFEEVPLSAGSPVRAAAAVDQSAYTITAEVPYTADLTNLAPTLTYIGRSVAGPSGGDRTANPFTDTGRNFTGDQIYTVKDQAGASQSYTVRVIRRSSVRVDFTGDRDTAVIKSNALDQSTGVIKFEVNTANVDPPYDWYLDGVKQGASGATFNLVVGDGSLAPGRHEVMVSGKKNGLHYTGKSSFTVSGVGS